jgi:transcriptional regulator with XRE-family HTH domain
MSLKVAVPNFAQALRALREKRGLSQEDFYEVSGRTYVSRLENDGAEPTLAKVGQLARVLGVHPLTLLTLTFCGKGTASEVDRLLANVRDEIAAFDELRLDRPSRRRSQ